ncbi:MAG: HAD-IA family hydrolase [Thermoanaerobaculia bacterium]|jgi:phosphoglycolate phosphatase|nr:MAG: HAD-IA family hydrolase [Thermoanaerobaculia bacterium]MBZ0101211.1 HAD-IA family hydrolase [Thermoanaerobaculia bacterium]
MAEPLAAPDRPFRLVVFDWDGTLMDSIGTIVECTLAALEDVPEAPKPPAERIRESIGLGLIQTMERFFPHGDLPLFERVAEAYRRRWLAEFKGRSTLLAGAAETVEQLHAEGYFVAIATAKSRAGLERELDQTGLRRFVHASRTVSEAPSKPAPGMLLQLFDELGVRSASALMIGDTAWDLQMAANAGCGGIGVLTGGHSRELLEAERPLACLDSVAHLPLWLGAGFASPSSQD